MKANRSSVGRAVDQPDSKIRLYLFLGPDEAQSRALAARLLQALGASKFTVPAAALKANPALLVDEAAALSLFGDRRLIWIEPCTNDVAEAAEALLAAESVESPVAAVAGALTKSSPLLKLAESSPLALAYTAYVPEGDDAARMVVDLGKRVGLKVSTPVAARLADACANDQAIARQELEKLALYVGASPQTPRDLEHEAIDAVGADGGESDLQQLADLALLGDERQLADAIATFASGELDSIPAIRALQRRIQMLAPARARIERGERVDAAMASLGKALFWKDKPAVQKMLSGWTADELAKLAARAGQIERGLIFSHMPEQEAVGQALLAIARRARGRPA